MKPLSTKIPTTRKLRELIEVLNEFGVIEFECNGLRLKLSSNSAPTDTVWEGIQSGHNGAPTSNEVTQFDLASAEFFDLDTGLKE